MFAMLMKEIQVEIEVLHRQGKGVREIARDTGVARNTVRAILRGQSDGQYGPRLARSSKLDAHKDYLRDRLERAGKTHLSDVAPFIRPVETVSFGSDVL